MQLLTPNELKPGMKTAAKVATPRGQVLIPADTELTTQLINRISFYHIAQVCVYTDEIPQTVNESSVKQQAAPVTTYSEKLKQSHEFHHFKTDYFHVIQKMQTQIANLIYNHTEPDYEDLKSATIELFRKPKTTIELLDLLHNMRSINDTIYAHSLNVALLSRMLGRWLHLAPHDLDILTLAGLLHDIGKAKIPQDVLNKPGKLTDEEFQEIQRHPKYGYEILKNSNLDSRIKKAALMHHERCDGSGYPMGYTEEVLDEFSMIVAIADVYDAMTAARSYRKPLCAFEVIENFEREGLQKYHTKYMLTFLQHIASIYQSNRVVLSDERKCNIVMLNPNYLSHPVVQFDDGSCLDLATANGLHITSIL